MVDARESAGLTTLSVPGPNAAQTSSIKTGRPLEIDYLKAVGLVLLLALWFLAASVLPPTLAPSPVLVAHRIYTDFFDARSLAYYGLPDTGLFWSMLYTTENVVVAVVLGSALGIFFGLITARVPLARSLIDPITLTAGTVPILVASPFFLIWFGIGRMSSVLLVALYTSIILYVFAQRAAENIDPVFEDSARTLGAHRREIIRDVLLPGTLPQILGGIRIALAGAWGLEAIAELMGSQEGMGKIIQLLAGATDVEGIFASLVILGGGAIMFDLAAAFVVSRCTSWNPAARIGRE